MTTNRPTGPDSESNFDQAVIAHLQTTNPDIARWVENTLCEDHTLTSILDAERHTLDPTDEAAVELVATATELWVIQVDSGLPIGSAMNSGSENTP